MSTIYVLNNWPSNVHKKPTYLAVICSASAGWILNAMLILKFGCITGGNYIYSNNSIIIKISFKLELYNLKKMIPDRNNYLVEQLLKLSVLRWGLFRILHTANSNLRNLPLYTGFLNNNFHTIDNVYIKYVQSMY